jgi:MYXO-CTERM domain-containing protein
MKTVSALAALIGLSVSSVAFAQLSTLPANSSADGVTPVSETTSGNAGASHWDDPSGIKAYNYQDPTNGNVPLAGSWSSTAPSGLSSGWSSIQTNGGTFRGIYVGETAGWKNDFGYTYDKTPVTDSANSFTLWTNIQGDSGNPGSPNFGDSFDINFLANDPFATNFDLWLNAGTGTTNGGVDTILDPANSMPTQDHVKWLSTPIELNTWVAADSQYEDVKTYLFSVEDWNLNNSGDDNDFSDFIMAVQLFGPNGTPLGGSPVPEASTYGLVGAAGLLGLAALRRRKAAKAQA